MDNPTKHEYTATEKRAARIDKMNELTDGLRVRINELLFKELPGDTTLDEMDRMALRLYTEVMSHWDRWTNEPRLLDRVPPV